MTRSGRRAEPVQIHSSPTTFSHRLHHSAGIVVPSFPGTQPNYPLSHTANTGRTTGVTGTKRPLANIKAQGHEYDVINPAKKAKFVEFFSLSRERVHHHGAAVPVTAVDLPAVPNPDAQQQRAGAVAPALSQRSTNGGPGPAPPAATEQPSTTKSAPKNANATKTNKTSPVKIISDGKGGKSSGPTKHREKVINGIRHELDRLQPSGVDTTKQGRTLRSQEATRFKSELSAYFPDYDEVIGNDPKEQRTLYTHPLSHRPGLTFLVIPDLLSVDTPIVLADSTPNINLELHYHPESTSDKQPVPVRGFGDALFTDLCDSQRIDFSFLESQKRPVPNQDPLADSNYNVYHKRAERVERSIRNSEKGRAQHEKDQIFRLLDALHGPDWLRVMGVSGITEGRKKKFEPARQHFIKGCENILEKFRMWNQEEKRRKLEKERALTERAEVEARNSSVWDSEADISDGDPPDLSDADMSAAKQLQEEALARNRISAPGKRKKTSSKQPHKQNLPHAPPPPPPPPKPITSFFRKRHERDSALSKSRRTGRNVMAFGHPVPEFPDADFELPEIYRDEETLRARDRKRRRERRGKSDSTV